jgi:hypothetical protein
MAEPSNPTQKPRNIWRQVITNPVTLGAIITAYVTVNTAIFGYLSARNSQRIEREKFEFQSSLDERKYETSLILEVAKAAKGDQEAVIRHLCILVEAGLIPITAEKMHTQTSSPCPPEGKPTPNP